MGGVIADKAKHAKHERRSKFLVLHSGSEGTAQDAASQRIGPCTLVLQF